MENKCCVQCYVSGKVQGVWFRASTQDQAIQLGLTGWARNLPDGRVEVMACGKRQAVQALLQWLEKGPELAQVSEMLYTEVSWQRFDRFSIL